MRGPNHRWQGHQDRYGHRELKIHPRPRPVWLLLVSSPPSPAVSAYSRTPGASLTSTATGAAADTTVPACPSCAAGSDADTASSSSAASEASPVMAAPCCAAGRAPAGPHCNSPCSRPPNARPTAAAAGAAISDGTKEAPCTACPLLPPSLASCPFCSSSAVARVGGLSGGSLPSAASWLLLPSASLARAPSSCGSGSAAASDTAAASSSTR